MTRLMLSVFSENGSADDATPSLRAMRVAMPKSSSNSPQVSMLQVALVGTLLVQALGV
ncbi:hypothetical protein [Tahibacter aquaticus]|uniref:hypothetical protein n=1 Tax=Tahibacter aquaticus TaxID=520092 RepID=UPI00141526AC|nr:hypothetical protein [Tahibacter aquaticus]